MVAKPLQARAKESQQAPTLSVQPGPFSLQQQCDNVRRLDPF